jgi:tetratricopeptide (TPR) repeat protein
MRHASIEPSPWPLHDRNCENFTRQSKIDATLDYLQQALAICRAIGDRMGLCRGLFNMGDIHLNNREPQQALASWVEAYRIAREIGWAEALQNLDNLAKQVGGPGLELWETLARQLPAGEDGG